MIFHVARNGVGPARRLRRLYAGWIRILRSDGLADSWRVFLWHFRNIEADALICFFILNGTQGV